MFSQCIVGQAVCQRGRGRGSEAFLIHTGSAHEAAGSLAVGVEANWIGFVRQCDRAGAGALALEEQVPGLEEFGGAFAIGLEAVTEFPHESPVGAGAAPLADENKLDSLPSIERR